MDKCKRARRLYRAQLTKAVNNINKALQSDEKDSAEIQSRLESMTEIFHKVEELDQEVLNQLIEEDFSEEQQEIELDDIEVYTEKYRLAKVKAEKFLSTAEDSIDHGSAASIAASATSRQSGFVGNISLKYPTITLKRFDGDIKEWLGFWSQFKHIHEDIQISKADKFQYLSQCMVKGSKGDAVVSSYPQSDENYFKAVEALQRRFGKEDLLVEVYVRELLKLVIANTNKGSKGNLSRMYDTLESHLRALESLGVTSDKYASMLFPLVESSLPEDLLRAWQRSMSFSKFGTAEKQEISKLTVLMEFLQREVESEERINLAKDGFGLPKTSKYKEDISKEESLMTAAGLYVGNEKAGKLCIFCKGSHDSDRCVKAQTMSLTEKKAKITAKRACYICLGMGHMAKACKVPVRCHICGKKHYVVMCPVAPTHKTSSSAKFPEDVSTDQEKNDQSTSTTMTSNNGPILLQTILVKAVVYSGKITARLMLDSGAQRSYVTDKLVKALGAEVVGQESIEQTVFGGSKNGPSRRYLYKLALEDLNGKNRVTIEALNQSVICGQIPKLASGPWLKELSAKGIWINDMNAEYSDIDILIGADFYGRIVTGKSCKLKSGLVAFETIFGWTVLGKPTKKSGVAWPVTNLHVSEATISELWTLETIGIRDPVESLSKAEREEFSKQHFRKTVKINQDGRYEIGLPWVVEKSTVTDNRAVAYKRLIAVTDKLRSTEQLDVYDKVFRDWLADDLIENVPKEETCLQAHYLPHRPVFKENSETTPIRPVFDASCKSGRAVSLNDCLEKGPNLLETIPSIMLRFRENKIGVIADIKKAFMMISVCPNDRDYLRFLWWNTDGSVREFRHKRVVFGVNCSPYLLGAVIERHLNESPEKYQETVERLKRCLYVDNCVTSVSSIKHLVTFRDESIELLRAAKMELRQWENSAVVNTSEFSESGSARQITSAEAFSSTTDVLGLKWDKVSDTLCCNIPKVNLPCKVTKRIVLSVTQKVFDPMGFLAPATLKPKLYLQEAWIAKLGWDAELPDHLRERFSAWVGEINILSEVKVPRWMTTTDSSIKTWNLHVFCDASQSAYAACVFLLCTTYEGPSVQLLQAKSRVAPVKKVTIPRLELMACLIGIRLARSVKEGLNMPNLLTTYWSDSTTALSWIKGDQIWSTFVRNRVSEIRTCSEPDDWKYVPGMENPADLPSRGCKPSKLVESRWWEGPGWLRECEDHWPTICPQEDSSLVDAELRRTAVTNVNATVSQERPWYAQRFESYSRTIRVLAWIQRFINNAKGQRKTGELSAVEIKAAEQKIVWIIQKEYFTKQKDFEHLQILTDKEGLIRVVTKITRREDPYDFRYPYLLPSKHPLVEALVKEMHLRSCHAGVQTLMTKLREKYWILRSRKTIARVKAKCIRCKRHEQVPCNSSPAPLPENRVQDAAVFQITGVDLAGPLYLKDNSKVWIALFTCAVYRAVHLELVTSLSTECFLQALRRFIARRGRPSVIYSDNGTNFSGCENAFHTVDWKYVTTKFAIERITWKFNPPTAAWWGGWWERIVRMIKRLLVRMLGRAILNYEELSTLMCDIEAVINARPLTYVSEDPQDLLPLSPSLFLQDIKHSEVYDIDEVEKNGFEKRYRYRQRLREDFRLRFRKEYLSQLIQKCKNTPKKEIRVGDVVLVETVDKRRIKWPLARVIETYPGRDGKIRVVRLKTASGELVRPIQRLYQMEAEEGAFETKKQEAEDSRKAVPLPGPTVTRSGRVVKSPERLQL